MAQLSGTLAVFSGSDLAGLEKQAINSLGQKQNRTGVHSLVVLKVCRQIAALPGVSSLELRKM